MGDKFRCRPVRLCDIPLPARMQAAQRVCRDEGDPRERQLIFAAALQPSRTIYWIRP